MQLGIDEQGNDTGHKIINRLKNLGSTVTDEQWEAIRSGSYKNLFVGDYWLIGDVKWRIVDIDYWWNTGDINCTKNHLVIMPDQYIHNLRINDTTDISGGYFNSEFRQTTIEDVKSIVFGVFGEDHILNHRDLFVNSINESTGKVGLIWGDSLIELPTCIMLSGNTNRLNDYDTINNSQLTLFINHPWFASRRFDYWVRDFGSQWMCKNMRGSFTNIDVTAHRYIRPVFGIC